MLANYLRAEVLWDLVECNENFRFKFANLCSYLNSSESSRLVNQLKPEKSCEIHSNVIFFEKLRIKARKV